MGLEQALLVFSSDGRHGVLKKWGDSFLLYYFLFIVSIVRVSSVCMIPQLLSGLLRFLFNFNLPFT